MRISIKNSIFQAILSNKWLDVVYKNYRGETTKYYLGIKDIDAKKGLLYCDIFNPYKSINIIENKERDTFVYVDKIKSASLLEQSHYDTPKELIDKVNNDIDVGNYLEIVNYDNNILRYLSDCYQMDNDPYLKEEVMIDGVDIHSLSKQNEYQLDEDQFKQFLDKVFKKRKDKAEMQNRFQTLAINKFSIDINGKQYVVAYRILTLNFKTKRLSISNVSSINKSFLIEEEKTVTLGMYLDMNPEEFCQNYDKNEKEYIEGIKQNFHNGEKVNTRPTIFFLERRTQPGVEQAFAAISQLDSEGKLSVPLKSFYGRNKSRSNVSNEIDLVVFDRTKINIDQLRVVYNSMINHVTYVKGPPGTGKTETIFNVILSAYVNDKTVLICSNNNHPVSDIYEKMSNSLTRKKPYTNETEKIIFPIIRLGNNEVMKEAVLKIREIIKFAQKHEKSRVKEELTETSKNRSISGFNELKKLITEYEEFINLNEKLNTLKKIRNFVQIGQINTKLDEQIAEYQKVINYKEKIKDDDVLKYTISASEDKNFQNYVYYSSLLKFKRISSDTYKEFRNIICNNDIDEAVKGFNKWLKDDLNLRRLLAIFPIIICTNLSCDKLGKCKPQFDLVIMDESGQCNIATSLIPIVRAENLLLVGDTNQLQPVTVIEEPVNNALLAKYGVSNEYNYIKNSILSLMLRKDNNSKNILLRYHYRCGQKIANFVNQRFYEKQLKLLNGSNGELIYYDVKNTFNPNARNSYESEAKEITKIIKNNKYKDVGIITPFVNQANLINDYLKANGINDVKAGTIHTLQGSEKSVIIMSAALSSKTGKKTMDWIKNNHELINVAVTRAKNKFIFVGDREAVDTLSKGESNDIKVLSDYVAKNGEVIVPKSDVTISYDFSNNSETEKDFFETVKPYFNKKKSKFRVERNIPVIDAIKKINENDLEKIGRKEFDVIVQANIEGLFRNYKTIVVFEIDGGEHIGNKRTAILDREKELICKKYGIKLIRIPNSAVKDYELIISLFEYVVRDLKNIDEAYVQMSLFDE